METVTTRELTCIGCPMGCPLTVTMEAGEVISVTGNTCKRGDIYARKEVTNPTRIVVQQTTSLKNITFLVRHKMNSHLLLKKKL